jgi:hypothetical protein
MNKYIQWIDTDGVTHTADEAEDVDTDTCAKIVRINGDVEDVFRDCTMLTSVGNIRGKVWGSAFAGCTNLKRVGDIQGDVAEYAFSGCSALVEVGDIGGDVEDGAFWWCVKLSKVGKVAGDVMGNPFDMTSVEGV